MIRINKSTLKVLLILLIVFFYRNEMYGQSKKFNKIQKIIDHSTKNNLIGVVVYIKMNDQPEWIGVSGYEDVANGIKLRSENIFFSRKYRKNV